MSWNNKDNTVVKIDKELEELIPLYLENRKKDIESITSALEKHDFETIRTLGHSMKGSGGGYGFDEISTIGKGIEQAAKSQDHEEIRRLIKKLSQYVENIQIIYE